MTLIDDVQDLSCFIGKINMAVKLAKAFDTTPQKWLNMQQQYDLWQILQEYQPDDVQVMHG